MKTINNLKDLGDSKFGQPDPRHGLELLYWFSHEYIDIYTNSCMKPKLPYPQNRAFGFCLFYNNEQILPKQNIPYHEVGNLHGPGTDKLPPYVTKKNTNQIDGSNKDRIIISLNKDIIEKVYVTAHKDLKYFDPDQTYEVSLCVIKQIRGMELEEFLHNCKNQIRRTSQSCTIDFSENKRIDHSSNTQERKTSRWWCTIL